MEGAFSLRSNGQGVMRGSSDNIQVLAKTDKPGIDIIVAPGTKGETVHIPVVITESGVNDLVYNDFFIGEGSDIDIVAGCAIHNDGGADSEHDGIHTFHIGKGAKLRYTEKHYGEGTGTGERILNPTTVLHMEENSVCEMETTQIEGVNSTVRETDAHIGKGARLIVTEKAYDP
jgi:Fe-S cluster assembly scaffold protein SufB